MVAKFRGSKGTSQPAIDSHLLDHLKDRKYDIEPIWSGTSAAPLTSVQLSERDVLRRAVMEDRYKLRMYMYLMCLILRPALLLCQLLCPKLFWDDCRGPHIWRPLWPLQYFVAFHYVEMVKLHVPHEASWGTWLLGNRMIFSRCFQHFLHKPWRKPTKTPRTLN